MKPGIGTALIALAATAGLGSASNDMAYTTNGAIIPSRKKRSRHIRRYSVNPARTKMFKRTLHTSKRGCDGTLRR